MKLTRLFYASIANFVSKRANGVKLNFHCVKLEDVENYV